MTWEIVVGLIALLGAFLSAGTQVAKLSRTLAMLEAAVKELKTILEELKSDNREEHVRIRETLASHEKRLLRCENTAEEMEKQWTTGKKN